MKKVLAHTAAEVNRQLRSAIDRLPNGAQGIIASIVVFGGLGTALLLTSHAATPAASVEVETGVIASNSTSVADTSASNGQAVKFGVAQTTSTWPDTTNTGYEHTGVTLHACSTSIGTSGTFDSCQFNGDITISGVCTGSVTISRSLINGSVYVKGPGGYEFTRTNLAPNAGCSDHGVVISDTTINCGCQSQTANDSPSAVGGLNFTLLRDNIYNSAHGVVPDEFVTIQDSYIHGLGASTDAHKDGIFLGDGDHMTLKHNNIECNDGPAAGCTSAIGILSDFSDVTYITFDNNLLNTIGSYCFYGSGGPQKPYASNHISFINNHFGRKFSANCGFYGPVTYFDVNAAGNVWSGNVWDDTGAVVPAEY